VFLSCNEYKIDYLANEEAVKGTGLLAHLCVVGGADFLLNSGFFIAAIGFFIQWRKQTPKD